VAAKVLDAALRADPLKLPAQAGVDLGADGYAVVNVKRIVSRTAPNGDAAKQAQQQYTQIWAAAENQAYYELLKDRYKARILISQPAANVVTP
jgi:peptidyl-prolyl cis-trans isomerase D